MAITFDGASRRIILDSAATSAEAIWSAWVDWLAADSTNGRWLPAMRQVGGDDLGGGLYIPVYIFLLNGWRVRPMEANHTLVIAGNLFVDGGGDAVVPTLGSYQVLTKLVVPVLAQGISTSGGGGASAADVWAYPTRSITDAYAIRAELANELVKLVELARIHGLESGVDLIVTPTSRTAGSIQQSISEAGSTVTVRRTG